VLERRPAIFTSHTTNALARGRLIGVCFGATSLGLFDRSLGADVFGNDRTIDGGERLHTTEVLSVT
jgi:hypothetical protein